MTDSAISLCRIQFTGHGTMAQSPAANCICHRNFEIAATGQRNLAVTNRLAPRRVAAPAAYPPAGAVSAAALGPHIYAVGLRGALSRSNVTSSTLTAGLGLWLIATPSAPQGGERRHEPALAARLAAACTAAGVSA